MCIYFKGVLVVNLEYFCHPQKFPHALVKLIHLPNFVFLTFLMWLLEILKLHAAHLAFLNNTDTMNKKSLSNRAATYI